MAGETGRDRTCDRSERLPRFAGLVSAGAIPAVLILAGLGASGVPCQAMAAIGMTDSADATPATATMASADPAPTTATMASSDPVPTTRAAGAAPAPGTKRAGPTSGIGAYLGFPSLVGLWVTAPVDGMLAFRSGLIGVPGVGVLWTPGLEIRFDQEPGTYNRDGYYGYGNLFLGRIYDGRDRETTGFETGFGYRWFFTDRRPLRWVVGFEAGGHWDAESAWPDRPSVRVFGMVAGY